MSEVVNDEGAMSGKIDLIGNMNELAIMRKRPVLCINHDMDWESVGSVRRATDYMNDADSLTVLLNSPGGDIGCAYRMLLALRDKAGDIEVLVPRSAKSAATFFCLGADSIHMGRYGELGPLDPQMFDRSGRARQVSALETFNALEHLLSYSVDSLDAVIQLLLRRSPMDIPHALDRAHPMFAAIASPLYGQIDPHELGESGRYLSISEEYAKRAMERWAYADLSDADRHRIAQRLIWGYPDHGFVIDLKEAQETGLKAERLDGECDRICREILSMSDDSVEFLPHEPVDIAIPLPKENENVD